MDARVAQTFLQSLPKARRDQLMRAAGGVGAPPVPAPTCKRHKTPIKFTPQEFARLYVKSKTLENDNVQLRSAVEQLASQNRALEGQIQSLAAATQQQQQHHVEQSALQIAELEDQLARQKGALSDLSRTAEVFARENIELKAQVEQLRGDKEDFHKSSKAMQERLSQLQSTCLALGAPRGGPGGSPGAAALPSGQGPDGSSFLEHVSATLLVLTREQAAAAPPVEPSRTRATAEGLPTDLRIALREVEAMRKEREGLRVKVKQLGAQLDKLENERRELMQSRAMERRGANVAATQLQSLLDAAKRKAEHLAGQVRDRDALLEEKGAYISKLEHALLAHSKRPASRGSRMPAAAEAAGTPAPAPAPNYASSPVLAAAATPMSLAAAAAVAACEQRDGEGRCSQPGNPTAAWSQGTGGRCSAAGGYTPEGWCSYHLGSPASSARCGGAPRCHPGSACQQAKRGGSRIGCQRPGEVRQEGTGPAAAAAAAAAAALGLAAGLDALEMECAEGLQRPLSAGERPCHAAPNNPLFSLSADGDATASPLRHAGYHIFASPRGGGGDDSPRWVADSPTCLAASLTFLHQNSLYMRSPSPPTRREARVGDLDATSPPAHHASLACAAAAECRAAPHSRVMLRPPVGGRAANGLLSPDGTSQGRAGTSCKFPPGRGRAGQGRPRSPEIVRGAASPAEQLWAVGAASGPCPEETLGGNGRAVLGPRGANSSVHPARRSLATTLHCDSDAGGPTGCEETSQPARAAPAEPASLPQVRDREPLEAAPAAAAGASRGAGAGGRRGGAARPAALLVAELACLEPLPEEGFGCVADLLEALTPKAAAATAAAGSWGAYCGGLAGESEGGGGLPCKAGGLSQDKAAGRASQQQQPIRLWPGSKVK